MPQICYRALALQRKRTRAEVASAIKGEETVAPRLHRVKGGEWASNGGSQ